MDVMKMFKLKKIGMMLLFLVICGLGIHGANATWVIHCQGHVFEGDYIGYYYNDDMLNLNVGGVHVSRGAIYNIGGSNGLPEIDNMKNMWKVVDSRVYNPDKDYVQKTICKDLVNRGYAKLVWGSFDNTWGHFLVQITNKSTSVEPHGYLDYYQKVSGAFPNIRYRITVNNGKGNLF